jgi:hypothetical protein
MTAGVDDAVFASDQFVTRIAADLAKAVVRMNNPAGAIGDRDDRMLVERRQIRIEIIVRLYIRRSHEGFLFPRPAPPAAPA